MFIYIYIDIYIYLYVFVTFYRDFAYVARDRSSRLHMCHVFRCDTPARHIANKLRDICKHIMLERTIVEQKVKKESTIKHDQKPETRACRPANLPDLQKNVKEKIMIRKFSIVS